MEIGTDIVGDDRVIPDLFHKEVLGKNGRPRVRILILLGGAQAGLVSAERVHACAVHGIPADHFDVKFAISVGTYIALAYDALQTALLRPMFLNFVTGGWWGMDPIQNLVDDIKQRLDQDTFYRCASEMFFGVSDSSGKFSWLGAKDSPNLFDLLYAASAFPPFSTGRTVDGIVAWDGALSHPCPVRVALQKVIRKWEPGTEFDLLLVANRPRPHRLPPYDPIMYLSMIQGILRWFVPPPLRIGAMEIDRKIADTIPLFWKERKFFRLTAWFASEDEYISPLDWNPWVLERKADIVQRSTHTVLKRYRPEPWV